jgi:hypothetical protein
MSGDWRSTSESDGDGPTASESSAILIAAAPPAVATGRATLTLISSILYTLSGGGTVSLSS